MKQQTLQPKLRFPEFDGEWKKINLGEIMNFKNGVNASKENYGFGFKFINVLDIINNNIITSDKIIGEVNISEKDFEKNIVEYGDILFQRSSETREEVGQSNVYLDDVPATFGGFVIRGKSISEYNSLYLHYLLKTTKARLEIITKSGGSTRFNVGQETLSNVVLNISLSLPEQQKIADYLTTIDRKIELLEEKKTELSRYKKAMMQKLFLQEIRFKDENGNDFPDWEEKKNEEVFDITRGYVLAVNKMSQTSSIEFKYPVYSSQTKENGLTGFYNEFLYEDAITWTTDGANAGTVVFRKGKFYCTNVCGVLISNFGEANVCIAEMINMIARKYVSYVGNPKLMNNVMAKIKIRFPSLPEQQKIADFLSAIDESISRVEEQIKETQSFKKAMLQQMFV